MALAAEQMTFSFVAELPLAAAALRYAQATHRGQHLDSDNVSLSSQTRSLGSGFLASRALSLGCLYVCSLNLEDVKILPPDVIRICDEVRKVILD